MIRRSSSWIEYSIDIREWYDKGVGSTLNRDMLRMLIDLQYNSGDGFVLSFYLIGAILLVCAYNEILDRYVDRVYPCQIGVCYETV